MSDLYLAMAIMVLVSAGLGIGAWRVARRLPADIGLGMLALLVGALIYFYVFWWDDVRIVKLIPLANAYVLGNLQPPIAAMVIGVAWARIPAGATRKMLLLVPLGIATLLFAYGQVFAPRPELGPPRWFRGVCRQTSSATCSPAAAATLLVAHDIPATEAELAELCLTTRHGTSNLGLYRALCIKTRGTPWRVEPFRATLDELPELVETPVILSVGLRRGQSADDRFVKHWGWTEGVAHTVVLRRFHPNGAIEIADPAVGREYWSTYAMETLWHGVGFRLVRR